MTASSKTHILFDLDGTLVDTRAAVTECYSIVFREELGSPFPPPGFPVGELFAMRPPEVFASVAPDKVEVLHAAYRAAYPRCASLVKVFAGVRDLILGLRQSGRKPSIVTNKGLERTLIDLKVADIPADAFEVIVTAEDTIDRKPHPAPILFGLDKAGADASDAIYVGDGPQDVLAARAAGLDAVAVTYGFYASETLAQLEPDHLVDDVASLAQALGVTTPAEVAG
ncbi:HAD family hydrolase [Rhizobium sp. TRM95796]|uniref:HAD family hydrolase n=1 Tax=Rhizobium sp. TRM95796 TaxID=2979862 RepID=UPI0021E8459E|nr:HAD hydrolase-like protein [Rhizobium sp. TRM95796]MCV3767778.1 HAD hydrolase-like protein [Rhizobium sp. TRM95796]